MNIQLPRRISVLLCFVLLCACSAPAAQTPTAAPVATVAPTAAPTNAPTAVPTSTERPTEAPEAAAGLLPSAIYLIESQIFRLEAADLARSQITYEVPATPESLPIIGMAVSPADGSLAYLVQRNDGSTLVRSGPNGDDPQPLYAEPGIYVSDPVFSPDGAQIAVLLSGGEGFASGIYRIPATGGAPELLVENAQPLDLTEFDPTRRTFTPARFSPDGTMLLTYQGYTQIEGCNLAIVRLADGSVTPVESPPAPEGEYVIDCSDSVSWAPDSSGVYFTPLRVGAPAGNLAIWRADAATGAVRAITPPADGSMALLYTHPSAQADGTVLALAALVNELPPAFSDTPLTLTYDMVRIDPTSGGVETVRAGTPGALDRITWAPDGSGLAALFYDDIGDPAVLFIPAGPGEPTLIAGGVANLQSFVWAK